MNNDLISIIIPVYNVENYLSKCIDSAINQKYSNLEIILINDGSTDKSGEICDEFAKKDARIKVVHKENSGVSSTRNKGLELAKGKYITFIDADDYVDENFVSSLYEVMIRDNTDLSICNVNPNHDFDGLDSIIDKKKALNAILDKNKFHGYVVNKLYKKELIGNIQFQENIHICEDLLFNCEYIAKCEKCSILDKKLYHYVKREDSAINNAFNMKKTTVIQAFDKMIDIYKQNDQEDMEILYIAYIKQYSMVKKVYQKNKKKLNDKQLLEKVKVMKKEITSSKKIGMKAKINVLMYYRFPIIIQTMREIYYKINKNKR